MQEPALTDFAPGANLPTVALPTPTLEESDRWMRAGDEFHAMHNDVEYARAAGHDDIVIAGLQLMAHLGRYLTHLVHRDDVRELGGRFESICYPKDKLSITGKVIETFEADGERRARFALNVTDATDGVRVTGEAIVALH